MTVLRSMAIGLLRTVCKHDRFSRLYRGRHSVAWTRSGISFRDPLFPLNDKSWVENGDSIENDRTRMRQKEYDNAYHTRLASRGRG